MDAKVWQDIETSPPPKDGTAIILSHWRRSGDGPLFCMWAEDSEWVGAPGNGAWDLTSERTRTIFPPTHWMPLRPPDLS